MEKFLALDIGNVCCHLQYMEMLKRAGFPAEEDFPPAWKQKQEALEKGRISEEAFFRFLSETSPEYLSGKQCSVTECREIFSALLSGPMEKMVSLVQELPGYGIQPVFFSDISSFHLRQFQNFFPPAEYYPGIYSFEVGEWKPHEKFFAAFEQKYGCPLLYADDRQILIDAAQKRGWNAWTFTNAEELARALGVPAKEEERPRGILFAEKLIRRFYPEDTSLRRLLLKHSRQVCQKAVTLWKEAPRPVHVAVNREILEAGALLHDIGIQSCHAPDILCEGEAPYLTHGTIGAQMLRALGGAYEPYARICERHTGSGITREDILDRGLPMEAGDYLPETATEKLICFADKFFSKSGDGEEKSWEQVEKSMARFGEGPVHRLLTLKKELCG